MAAWRIRRKAMLPQELIRLLQVILDGSDVAADVRAIMGKFVIAMAVIWFVLLGMGVWIMWMKGK